MPSPETPEATQTPRTPVGVMLPRDLPVAEILPFARRAEELGFDELWVVEDLGFRGGLAQAGVVLGATDRITVGIGILPVGARNVAFAATELNTLAELFPGRVLAGIGHGLPLWMREVGAWPRSPLTLLEEYSQALRTLLRGERLTVEGRYVQVDGTRLKTPAPQAPPVLLGVRGPRSLAVAGRAADGVVLAEPAAPAYVRAAVGHVGADGPHALVAYNFAVVDDDAAVARDAVRPLLEWVGDADCAPHVAPLPFADELAALRASSATRADFVAAMPDAWVDELALVGSPERVRARLAEIAQAGATSTVLIPVGADRVAALDALARAL
ncbi:LLM class flavin-dependent oxidoreductase [Cellulomonas sp. PhB143]|uniref:LLM class flavin-dependent oxidoreductase n=1 Tax=Cellulomonas sp. PhB143 TaxID=2485186 RepID=UPI000F90B832|nr:LLM class flavin-dependent oxidoreductase [Cellulomonas sp. PhB143]ROS75339.1 alkanesulfonate monooxygenase SsuD/methylene tetrahydromethanopterin reductase-like flavin-dependent oxidoreductase (luciferase family) [Cellulomonas sp. PhB143]